MIIKIIALTGDVIKHEEELEVQSIHRKDGKFVAPVQKLMDTFLTWNSMGFTSVDMIRMDTMEADVGEYYHNCGKLRIKTIQYAREKYFPGKLLLYVKDMVYHLFT